MKVIYTTIFLQPTGQGEMANIISSLKSSKASEPNSISYRIYFTYSKQLPDLFNLSFMTGVFPSLLKTTNTVPVFQKD